MIVPTLRLGLGLRFPGPGPSFASTASVVVPPTPVPLQVAGLTLWFDGSDASSITLGSGTDVAQWNDKSGNNNHAVQATSADRFNVASAAQNGLNTVALASGQVMTLTSPAVFTSTGYTIVSAVRRASNNFVGFGKTTDISRAYLEWFSDTVLYSDGITKQVVSTAQASTAYNQVSVDENTSGTGHIFFNGADVKASDANAAGAPSTIIMDRIGEGDSTYTVNGMIAELCVYNSVLSTTDRQSVEAYLKAKWATP